MHRIDGPAAAPGGLFTEGDPNVGTPATVVTDDWLNAVQTELENVATAAGAALSKPNNAQVLQAIQALIARAVPPGALQDFARATAPTGWLVCDGSAVGRTAYAGLFAAIGTTFGAGDGSTTFNLPDLRGQFRRGWANGFGLDAARAFGSAQADSVGPHVHPIFASVGGTESRNRQVLIQNAAEGDELTSSDYIQQSSGTETRPSNVAVLSCIKT